MSEIRLWLPACTVNWWVRKLSPDHCLPFFRKVQRLPELGTPTLNLQKVERRKGVIIEQQTAGGADRKMKGDLGKAMSQTLSVSKGEDDVGDIEPEPNIDLEGDDVEMEDA